MPIITTLFRRDPRRLGHPVVDRVTPGCEWVLSGHGIATVKVDGHEHRIVGGILFKRQASPGSDRLIAQYARCSRIDPIDRWAFEAFDTPGLLLVDGYYELLGPRINRNTCHLRCHELVPVLPPASWLQVEALCGRRSFVQLRTYLEGKPFEGLVFHDLGRYAKVTRRDFGLEWPVRIECSDGRSNSVSRNSATCGSRSNRPADGATATPNRPTPSP